jgi:hypothetical protein
MLRFLRFWFAASAICLSSCTFFSSPRLPSDLSKLADRTERIDFDFEPPANKVLPLLRLGTGTVRLGQFEARSSFRREDEASIFDISLRQGPDLLMDLNCHYNFRGLSGKAVEYWDCWSKPSRLGIVIFVSDGLLIRVAKSGREILSSPLPPRMVRVDGNTTTILLSGQTGAGENGNPASRALAAIVVRDERVALFIPRDDSLRKPALAAFLLAILIKAPYLGLVD